MPGGRREAVFLREEGSGRGLMRFGSFTKLSLTASKSVEITDSFSMPLMASYYLNPYSERSYFIFGISL